MRRAALIAVACALALAACGVGQKTGGATRQRAGGATRQRPRRPAGRGAAAPSASPQDAQQAVTIASGQPYVAIAAFRSPHGKIVCSIDAEDARCAISRPSWAVRSPCSARPTQVLILGRRGPAGFDCARAGAPGHDPAAKALPYGTVATADGFLCESDQGGVQCGTGHNGHGFFISPPLVRLF
jgi:hypothetical protein